MIKGIHPFSGFLDHYLENKFSWGNCQDRGKYSRVEKSQYKVLSKSKNENLIRLTRHEWSNFHFCCTVWCPVSIATHLRWAQWSWDRCIALQRCNTLSLSLKSRSIQWVYLCINLVQINWFLRIIRIYSICSKYLPLFLFVLHDAGDVATDGDFGVVVQLLFWRHVVDVVDRCGHVTVGSVREPVRWVGVADVGAVAVGLNLEEPRQGVERRSQQDRDDEGARADLVLQTEERATHHDVSRKCGLNIATYLYYQVWPNLNVNYHTYYLIPLIPP